MLALLWLLIALLPLRALSQELMGTAQPADAQRAAMPCHAGAGHTVAGAPDRHHASAADATVATNAVDAADGAASDEHGANCSACDLCHAALAGPVYATRDPSLPAAGGPAATAPRPSAAVSLDGIFKPPRG